MPERKQLRHVFIMCVNSAAPGGFGGPSHLKCLDLLGIHGYSGIQVLPSPVLTLPTYTLLIDNLKSIQLTSKNCGLIEEAFIFLKLL